MEIDTVGTFNMSRAAFPLLKESKVGGNIISLTATLHYTATWWQTAPVAAKAAIDAMSRNLALEWSDYGIRVNTIAPGPIAHTAGLEKLTGGGTGEGFEFPQVPLKRCGSKAEIASAC